MRATVSTWSGRLVGLILAGLELSSCRPRPKAPVVPTVEVYITRDERVDDWRLDGAKSCPRVLRVPVGCYVLEAKFEESYTRVHGASPLWGISWAAAALDTATRIHTSKYETDYVPFAVKLQPGHRYYVTATFDGDEFSPRIVELNAKAERTREILPAASVDEVKACKALGAPVKEDGDAVCTASRTRR
jgi:hypothetical protein